MGGGTSGVGGCYWIVLVIEVEHSHVGSGDDLLHRSRRLYHWRYCDWRTRDRLKDFALVDGRTQLVDGAVVSVIRGRNFADEW